MEDSTPKFADDELSLVVQQFEEFDDGTTDARELWEKCRAYRDGDQYTTEERDALKKRKQPCITDNKIQDKVNTLLGIERQMRTDPKAFPRNPSPEDEKAAEAATDALRFVADQSRYNMKARKGAAENLIIEGICFGLVELDKKSKDRRVCMERIRQDRGYYDIRSLEDDFSDKRYCGYFTWMDEAEVLEAWPKAKDVIESHADGAWTGNRQHDDKPRYILTSGKRRRIQVFTHFHIKGGKWHESVWVRGGWLAPPRPCVYRDEEGKPQCPMEIQALYRDADGNPYGEVKRYLDLQDEHNKRRSKMLHLLTAKRVRMRRGAVDDVNALRSEIHKPDGVVEINGAPEDIVIEDNLKEAEGQWRLLHQTEAALSATGPNDALQGNSGSISGIAKARDQQAGQLLIGPFFDALDAWEWRMYRQAWCRVKQFWKTEKWVRVTDSEEKPKWVGLNMPVTIGEQLMEAAAQDPQFQQLPDEEKRAVVQQIAARPEAQQPAIGEDGRILKRNSVGEMDVDIIIDRGQDVVTVQQEEFAQLAEIASGRPEIPFDVLVEMSQLRATTKKRVLERMKGLDDPQAQAAAQQQAQFQQALQQLQLIITEAQARAENARAAKDEAAAAESQVDAAVKVGNFLEPPTPAGKTQVMVS